MKHLAEFAIRSGANDVLTLGLRSQLQFRGKMRRDQTARSSSTAPNNETRAEIRWPNEN